MCVCVSWVAETGGGKFYEHGSEAIIHYTAEQTRDYTGNYLILAILQLAGSHAQHVLLPVLKVECMFVDLQYSLFQYY